jgi:hypothetical protein
VRRLGHIGRLFVAIATIGCNAACHAEATPSASARRWTVDDNIRIQRLPSFIDFDWSASPFHYSPDRSHVAFVVLASDVTSDDTEARLRVYDTAVLDAFARGTVAVAHPAFEMAIATRESRPAISAVKWARSGRSMLFIARGDGGPRLMEWTLGERAARVVASDLGAIWRFEELDAERIALFVPHTTSRNPPGQPSYAPIVANGSPVAAFVRHKGGTYEGNTPNRLVVVNRRSGEAARGYDVVVNAMAGELSVSPDGYWIAFPEARRYAWNTQGCWRESDIGVAPETLYTLDSGDARIALLNLKSGSVERPFNGPVGAATGKFDRSRPLVEWSADGERLTAPYTLSVHDSCAASTARRGSAGPHMFSLRDRSFSKLAATSPEPRKPASLHAPNALEVREDYNAPPAIHALGRDGSSRLLHDLAPHARGRALGTVELFKWLDSRNQRWEGLLAFPPDYDPTARYPLIIQTHGFGEHKFWAEGATTTAFPGRAATARGFVVLTVRESRDVLLNDRRNETKNMLDGYRSAIAALAERGSIDRGRVGIIGWSRTSYHVKYALTQAPDLFRGAVVADGVDYGYWQYLLWLDLRDNSRDIDGAYGGTPWTNWQTWLAEAPGFNVHRVRAPLRIESCDDWAGPLLAQWEFYAGLKHLDKPVELVLYPEGEHSLVRPLERRSSTEGSLDWLDYWINGQRDPDPRKAPQYARWDALPR